MVIINNNNTICIIIKGDAENYLNALHALCRLIATQDPDMRDNDTTYYAACLLEDMLPDQSQKIEIN